MGSVPPILSLRMETPARDQFHHQGDKIDHTDHECPTDSVIGSGLLPNSLGK